MNIVLDTNILISALIKNSLTRGIIINSSHNFLLPEFELEEIENHKEEILEKSKLSKEDFYILLFDLLRYVKIIKLDKIINYRQEAYNIIGNIDEDDTIFIATALAFDCPIWTDDKDFKKQKIIKIYSTSEMKEISGL